MLFADQRDAECREAFIESEKSPPGQRPASALRIEPELAIARHLSGEKDAELLYRQAMESTIRQSKTNDPDIRALYQQAKIVFGKN